MIKIDLHYVNRIIEVHSDYIINNIYMKYEKLITNKSYSINRKSIKVEYKEVAFLSDLFGKSKDDICSKLIYICTLNDLCKIVKEFELKFYKTYKVSFSDEIHKPIRQQYIKVKKIVKLLSYLLNYDSFNKGKKVKSNYFKTWSRHDFICALGIKVCPYCNRNYITSYEDKEAEKTTADADHYYPKSLYPILQLNIFNMIPSCSICNSKMKNDNDLRHLYPYEDMNDSLKFSTSFETIEELYNFQSSKICIISKKGGCYKRAENSKEVFKLENVYQIHKDIVFELINRIKDYQALKKLRNQNFYKVMYGTEILTDEEIFNYWFDFLKKEPKDEPLVKLKQDIYFQIKEQIY